MHFNSTFFAHDIPILPPPQFRFHFDPEQGQSILGFVQLLVDYVGSTKVSRSLEAAKYAGKQRGDYVKLKC
jgi:hypothetical protein